MKQQQNSSAWQGLHQTYSQQDWITKPSLFAETAITYFPKTGRVLELGAGLGQDTQFFAEQGYQVTSTDLEPERLKEAVAKLPDAVKRSITVNKLDLRERMPFQAGEFDVVYAHLSLHYFDLETTHMIFAEIQRILKPGGIIAFLTNSVHDPEYKQGKEIEPDYFQIDQVTKRYLSTETARELTKYFDSILLDDHGETYKDAAKGVHGLTRYIGAARTKQPFNFAVPFVGAIIERQNGDETEVLVQTRMNPGVPRYYGTIEFPAGRLDKPFENVFDTLAREIHEEAGLKLKAIKQDSRTQVIHPQGDDAAFGFRPFCCTQQLAEGTPWIGFVFVCEVESGEPKSQLSEVADAQWMKAKELKLLLDSAPEKFFTLEIPAWQYYFETFGQDE